MVRPLAATAPSARPYTRSRLLFYAARQKKEKKKRKKKRLHP
jgi:hypothetical protein